MNIGSISNNYSSALISNTNALSTTSNNSTQVSQSQNTTTQTDTLELSEEAKALVSNFEELLSSEGIESEGKKPKMPPPKDGMRPNGPPPKNGMRPDGPPPKNEVEGTNATDISAISSQMTSFSSFTRALSMTDVSSSLNLFA